MATTAASTTSAIDPTLDLVQYQKDLAAKKPTTATETASAKSGSSAMGKEDFMKLLVTQLRFQDPLAPQDNQQMAAQMAQFSSLESMQNVQKAVEALGTTFTDMSSKQSESASAITSSSATSMIGKSVRFKQVDITRPSVGKTSDLLVHGGLGSAVVITNAAGETVRTIALDGTKSDGTKLLNSSGDGTASWDGLDDNHQTAAAGSYTISIRDLATQAETGYAYQDAAITSVSFDSNGPLLETGSQSFRMKELVEVHNPAVEATTADTVATTAKEAADAATATANAAANAAATTAALGLVGKTVCFRDAAAELNSKGASWTYAAADGSVGQILNSKNEVVRSFSIGTNITNPDGTPSLDSTKGTGSYTWDGNIPAGSAPDGTYYLRIVDPTQTTTTGTAYRQATVESLAFDAQGAPRLVSEDSYWSLQDLFTI